jgi:streptogramin lyase
LRAWVVATGTAAIAFGACCATAQAVSITEFPDSALADPQAITAGPDGNLWFTDTFNNKIGRITPAGAITEFPGDTTTLNVPQGITAGPDGNLWFADTNNNKIGRITPAGAITEFPGNTTTLTGPVEIAAGPDGNLWFTDGNKIGRITPAGAITEFSGGLTGTFGIAAGPDGNLWFADSGNNKIGRITPAGAITEFPGNTTTLNTPSLIAAGPDGNLWFTDSGDNKIGQITPAGVISEFPNDTATLSSPLGIAAGADGNVWFTDKNDSRVGRITPAGTIDEFATLDPPRGIAAGPDGNLWFAESGNRIGRVTTDLAAPSSGNLLRDPGFESGVAVLSDAATAPLAGWAAIPNFTAVRYGAQPGFPSTIVGAQVGGGSTFAIGGPANAQSEAIQQVDVSAQAQAIDEGRATMTLAGLLGGLSTDTDAGTVTATLLSAADVPLGSVTIGPVTAADRGGQTTLLPRSGAAAVVAGTRAIRVTATATRASGAYNDASFDNLSLTLEVTPPPSGPGGAVAAAVGSETLSPTAFAAGPHGPSAVAAKRRFGTRVNYTLNEAANVRFTVVKPQPGARTRGGRCVKPTKANRRARRCTRLVAIRGFFTRPGSTGANKFRFTGRMAGRRLKPGKYQLVATPSAGGKAGRAASAAFRIIK